MTSFENYLEHLQRFGIRPGLERVRELLARLDNPQRNYPVVLVGGTNGKGSTCEFLARRLANEGKTVGLFTSPHLYRWNERLRVLDSVSLSSNELFPGSIADDELDALFNEMRPLLEEIARDETLGQPTEFETLTALGLLHFARRKVDIAVVEVGLGGKWDATNVTNPLVSVVTHVALDHCDRLGNTHVEIARDKVEIARPNCIFVTSETRADVLEVFRAHCDKIGAKLWSSRNIEYSNDAKNLKNALDVVQPEVENDVPDFQKLNAQTAFVARLALTQSNENWTLPVQNGNVIAPIATVPGRFQVVRHDPLVVLDGANNPDGAAQLAHQLRRVLDERSGSELILVLGILKDKDFRAMIAQLAPLATQIVATQSTSPRACEAQVIADEARQFCQQVEIVVPVQSAVARALSSSTRSNIVCVTGSFYTISEARLSNLDS